MNTKFKGERRWINERMKRFSELEDHLPASFNSDQDCPDWVMNLLIILTGISHPGIKLRNIKKWKAKELGQFLGRQFAGEQLIEGKVPVTAQVTQEAAKFLEWAGNWAEQKYPDFDWNELFKKQGASRRIRNPLLTQFIQETLATACERPYTEASAFFEAFGKATVMKPDEFETERKLGVGDKICWTMFVMSKDIERLESVAQLHRILEQALKPKGVIVRYKRIEKLCQRIKLKFKGPGRPPANKTQTNPPSL